MNRLLVVTGGTKGIGRAIAEQFSSHAFDVVTCSRNEQELAAMQKDLQERYKNKVITMKADLSVKEEVLKFSSMIKALNRPVDVLVNNTGVFVQGQIHQEEEGVLEKLMNTNVYSAYHLIRELIPGMISRKQGSVFNICSTASIMPYVNGGSYCVTKYALYGMTKVLREEMKPHHVKVTAVLPGATFTASWEGVDLPKERFMKPEDVAQSIWSIFQLSQHSDVEEILIRPQLGDI